MNADLRRPAATIALRTGCPGRCGKRLMPPGCPEHRAASPTTPKVFACLFQTRVPADASRHRDRRPLPRNPRRDVGILAQLTTHPPANVASLGPATRVSLHDGPTPDTSASLQRLVLSTRIVDAPVSVTSRHRPALRDPELSVLQRPLDGDRKHGRVTGKPVTAATGPQRRPGVVPAARRAGRGSGDGCCQQEAIGSRNVVDRGAKSGNSTAPAAGSAQERRQFRPRAAGMEDRPAKQVADKHRARVARARPTRSHASAARSVRPTAYQTAPARSTAQARPARPHVVM